MEDKTPLYMVLIVALVAVVGLVIVLTHGSGAPTVTTSAAANTDNSLTGNAVYDTSSPVLNTFGKIFFSSFLIGIVAYMYFRKDE
jgi:hypothetical protein